jgi:hypothetical protein
MPIREHASSRSIVASPEPALMVLRSRERSTGHPFGPTRMPTKAVIVEHRRFVRDADQPARQRAPRSVGAHRDRRCVLPSVGSPVVRCASCAAVANCRPSCETYGAGPCPSEQTKGLQEIPKVGATRSNSQTRVTPKHPLFWWPRRLGRGRRENESESDCERTGID